MKVRSAHPMRPGPSWVNDRDGRSPIGCPRRWSRVLSASRWPAVGLVGQDDALGRLSEERAASWRRKKPPDKAQLGRVRRSDSPTAAKEAPWAREPRRFDRHKAQKAAAEDACCAKCRAPCGICDRYAQLRKRGAFLIAHVS